MIENTIGAEFDVEKLLEDLEKFDSWSLGFYQDDSMLKIRRLFPFGFIEAVKQQFGVA